MDEHDVICSWQPCLKSITAVENSVFRTQLHSLTRIAVQTSSMCESNQISQKLSGVHFSFLGRVHGTDCGTERSHSVYPLINGVTGVWQSIQSVTYPTNHIWSLLSKTIVRKAAMLKTCICHFTIAVSLEKKTCVEKHIFHSYKEIIKAKQISCANKHFGSTFSLAFVSRVRDLLKSTKSVFKAPNQICSVKRSKEICFLANINTGRKKTGVCKHWYGTGPSSCEWPASGPLLILMGQKSSSQAPLTPFTGR